jgi:hypothetical protein
VKRWAGFLGAGMLYRAAIVLEIGGVVAVGAAVTFRSKLAREWPGVTGPLAFNVRFMMVAAVVGTAFRAY